MFHPISIDAYARKHVRANPGADVDDVVVRLRSALAAVRAGRRCNCGGRIWVIGAVEAGLSCFTCITGEADPSGDYEIAEALDR